MSHPFLDQLDHGLRLFEQVHHTGGLLGGLDGLRGHGITAETQNDHRNANQNERKGQTIRE